MSSSVLAMSQKTGRPKREVDLKTRQRISDHLRWWMLLNGKSQADVERQTGVHNSTISRLLKLTQRSLGLDVFLKLSRKLEIDAHLMLNETPDWERLARVRGRQAVPIRQMSE